jgi:hypothetical protein
MKESEIRKMIGELKGVTTIHIVNQDGADDVIHAEAHDEDGVIFLWPKGARQKIRHQSYGEAIIDFQKFSLLKKDYDISYMERDMVV